MKSHVSNNIDFDFSDSDSESNTLPKSIIHKNDKNKLNNKDLDVCLDVQDYLNQDIDLDISSPRNTKLNDKKSTHKLNTEECESNDEVDVLQDINYDVNYEIQSHQSTALNDFNRFFDNPNLINEKDNPTTNIIDRFRHRCYKIPDHLIHKMFYYMEKCRLNENISLMMCEKQQEYSGIMLDFDIYQDYDKTQLTSEIFYTLIHQIITLLIKWLDISEKKETIYVGITRKPKVLWNETHQCYKDGFHLLIPSIKVRKEVKNLLIKKLIDKEWLEQSMKDVKPTKKKINNKSYTYSDFIDKMSSVVPVFFIGSTPRKNSPPHKLSYIYKIIIKTNPPTLIIEKDNSLLRINGINVCNEFSLNWESKLQIIKKKQYDIKNTYIDLINQQIDSKTHNDPIIQNFGRLAMHNVNDPSYTEIKNLLDALSQKRSDDYQTWYNVLCVLAHESISYKPLAEYFSRKSKKFTMAAFENTWNTIIERLPRTKTPLTMGSLHYWAKIDNPDRYQHIKKASIYTILYRQVYESHLMGSLQHAQIAQLCHKLLQYKYVVDYPPGAKHKVWYEFIIEGDKHKDGELYKWRVCNGYPENLSLFIQDNLKSLCASVEAQIQRNVNNAMEKIAFKYHNKVLSNFRATMRKLGDKNFIHNIITLAMDRFAQRGFADNLDANPLIRGVHQGILKLSLAPTGRPILIKGYHPYLVSKYTSVPYIAFNPYDPKTKKILLTLRSLFPNNEPDSFEFTMYYLASTIDGLPKESIFMMIVGSGSNGKSFLMELHKSAIGDHYGVKLELAFLTDRSKGADRASPNLMQLRHATLAFYSESNQNDVLNAAKIKEITGLETVAGRSLYGQMSNFKPRCHHVVISNYKFIIDCQDHGIWRRIIYNPLKIKFIPKKSIDHIKDHQYIRIADESVTKEWTTDPEILGRYLGYMVWMHYWLYRNYAGKVRTIPCPHIEAETAKYRYEQNNIDSFIAQRFVKCVNETAQHILVDECQKYITWYRLNNNITLTVKAAIEQISNSQIQKHILQTARGEIIQGHRFLDHNETPQEGEEYVMKNITSPQMPADNFGIASETPEEFYQRVCQKYDQYKHLFCSDAQYDVNDNDIYEYYLNQSDQSDKSEQSNKSDSYNLCNSSEQSYLSKQINQSGQSFNTDIIPKGMELKQLQEPILQNKSKPEFDMSGYLPLNIE